MNFRIIPFVLLLIPIAEIAVFILVGQYIGVLPTLGLILATAVLGTVLLRVQGFGLLNTLTIEANAGRVPGKELVHGAMIVIAALLLITPGFLTDILGFLLFIPAVRNSLWQVLKSRMTIISTFSGFSGNGFPGPESGRTPRDGGNSQGPIVDLDDDEFQRRSNPQSPWRGKSIDQD